MTNTITRRRHNEKVRDLAIQAIEGSGFGAMLGNRKYLALQIRIQRLGINLADALEWGDHYSARFILSLITELQRQQCEILEGGLYVR